MREILRRLLIEIADSGTGMAWCDAWDELAKDEWSTVAICIIYTIDNPSLSRKVIDRYNSIADTEY